MTSSDSADLELPPDPAALIESMRAFGYSLPTAVADLVDNSISAGANSIDIEFRWDGTNSTLAVIDDGRGMSESELTEAMRLGSSSPVETRSPTDLGRFGLGLKSAAWSQARSLTVISRRKTGPHSTRRWDLDHVTETRQWRLLTSPSEAGAPYADRLAPGESGTVVLLERPDRMVGPVQTEDEAAMRRFIAAAAHTADHLAMVFHRFLAGRSALTLKVNGKLLIPWDAFLSEHPATQRLPTDELKSSAGRVHVAPYVLPHASKLDIATHQLASGPAGWNAQQGFYVYRGRRLLVAGDWLGLRRMQQEEHYKLARIRIDLDNSMDELWQIDVRKATARIPGPLHAELNTIAQATRRKAAEAYRFRGKLVGRASQRSLDFVWERVTERGGVHRFRVNRRHPVIAGLLASSDPLGVAETVLRVAEEHLPIEAIVMDSRETPTEHRTPFANSEDAVSKLLRDAHDAMTRAGTEPLEALRALAVVEPFDAFPELVEILREELAA